MRTLIESTFVTLDGVVSSPEQWGPPYWNDEHNNYARELLFGSDALLLGRETYEGFAEAWSARSGDEYTDRINALPKYVASTTRTEGPWNATFLGQRDTAKEIAAIKDGEGGRILKFGSGSLDRTLIENDLVDEFHLWVFPVIAGSGERLLDGVVVNTHLRLVRSTPFSTGLVVHTFARP